MKLSIYFQIISSVTAVFNIPNLKETGYIEDGDILLGGIFRVHEYSDISPCSDIVRSSKSFQYFEAMVYAIKQVNIYIYIYFLFNLFCLCIR